MNSMGLFRRKQQSRVVQVSFREIQPLETANLQPGGTYDYTWPFKEDPQVGQWVYVEGHSGRTTAVIYAIGGHGRHGGPESPVLGLVPQKTVDAALAKHNKAISNYFDQARKQVGLPFKGRVGTTTPEHWKPIPPFKTNNYTAAQADEYGRAWWRIHKQAEEHSRPSDEVRAYKSAAYAWFARRDKSEG